MSTNRVESPDGKLVVELSISPEQEVFYSVRRGDVEVIPDSRLGLVREDADFTTGLRPDSSTPVEKVRDDYEMKHGKQRLITYEGNRRSFRFKNADGKALDVIFQVSNDGVAFRYHFPEESSENVTITHEVSSFNFLPGTTAWLQPMSAAKTGWSQVNPSYEEHYIQDVVVNEVEEREPGWVFPALFKSGDNWILLSETAPDRNYCGSRLGHKAGTDEFSIQFPQVAEVFPGGALNPESTLPWTTPWRIIVIGGLDTIVESTLGTDLAKPAVLDSTAWIRPGRASWSWVLLKDDMIVYDVQKAFIDYSADMGWEYCLIDVKWDTNIGYYRIQQLAKYAAEKNVGLILWYNSSGDWNSTTYHPKSKLLTHADRVTEFGRLKSMGIKGIKVDFFGGDGQSMMAYYQDIFEDAARFGLLVNCHGSTIPRGWQRTYPNLISMEAVKGFEFVTFEQVNADLQPEHCSLQPFTRNVFDPMDFTPVCFSEVPGIRRRTTNAFELALTVLLLSGVQHYAEIPAGMANVPEYVRDLLRAIPVSWDETRFVAGFPGRFVVIARRYHDIWYIAGINGQGSEKKLTLDLAFVSSDSAILVTDGPDTRTFEQSHVGFSNGQLELAIRGNGGFVLRAD
jgi:hypothetical protein